MARVALPGLLLLLAALPTAQAFSADSAGSTLDLAGLLAGGDCIGPKLTGDQALIARPYPGGGYEVFAGVDPSSITAATSPATDTATVGPSGGDYIGAGAYVLGPGCALPEAIGI